jgi:signal transduction histidine kinase
VAALFGGVIILQTRSSTSRILYQGLEENTLSTTRSLATELERPMITGDLFTVKRKLQRSLDMIPPMRYIIVRDPQWNIVAHTFERAVPTDLLSVYSESRWGTTRVLDSEEGLIFDTAFPILDGHGGSVQLGMSDHMITREIPLLTQSLLKGLALCVSLGAVLALGLTHILTQPIRHLVRAADRIGKGDFETKAKIFSADEIGRLAIAFNEMSESLASYRQEVQEKERARLSLIEGIIQAQEEERKKISRELHDQLGQTLLALLLMVQSCCHDGQLAQDVLLEMEKKVSGLIDEIHRLVQGMRPPILDDYGLDIALSRLVEEVSNFSGLSIDYQYSRPPGLGRLPGRVEVTLYRIAQEAITNIVRHARVDRASLVVLQQRQDAVLLVEDRGCGFDPVLTQSDGDARWGLAGMKERAALLGGSCTVESVAGEGTTVRVKVPITEGL